MPADIARDVGGKRPRLILRAAIFAEIAKRQREGRRHAQPLRDPQQCKYMQPGRIRQQRGGHREQHERHDDACAARQMAAEQRHAEPGDRHAERARINGHAHRGGGYAVTVRQQRQDRLRGEQVHHGEESGECDHKRAQRTRARGGHRWGGRRHRRGSGRFGTGRRGQRRSAAPTVRNR